MPAAFYNNWYEGDLAYRKMLLILMMRSTKPYMWRTYKLAPVSITTYMAVSISEVSIINYHNISNIISNRLWSFLIKCLPACGLWNKKKYYSEQNGYLNVASFCHLNSFKYETYNSHANMSKHLEDIYSCTYYIIKYYVTFM